MDLGISGLASGFDWRSMVDQLAEVDRAPQKLMQTEQTQIQQRNQAYSTIQNQLSSLLDKLKALKDPTLYDSRSTTSSDNTLATATASKDTAAGTYRFKINALATSTVLAGTTDRGANLSATDDVSSLVLSSAGFANAVTAGTFTVNGKQITVATSDTLQQVFDKISSATGGAVTGTYSSTDDTLSLQAAAGTQIILGSANDTSNFLGVARLSNNGTNAVTSSAKLGTLKTASVLSSANFSTAISDGGSHAGSFKVNGVSISFDASKDTINDVLARINNSTAGVTANYDPTKDRFVLTNKTTGNVGVALQDVTGNFLAASGLLSTSGLTLGSDLQYQLNDSTDVLTSKSNTIDEVSSGITGLSVAVLNKGSVTVQVDNDKTTIKNAIKDFITEYNKSQSALDTYTSSSTDNTGKVTAGALAGERDAFDITSQLRSLSNSKVTGLSGTMNLLSSLGITSNGTDNTLTLSDETALDNVLSTNMSGVKEFFSNTTTGMASRLYDYVNRTAGDDSSLTKKQATLGKQITDLDDQIATQEKQVLERRSAMIDQFVLMEQAQAQINQQMTYISKIGQ